MKIDIKEAKKYIDYPCPKCKSNMFTKEEYKKMELPEETLSILQKMEADLAAPLQKGEGDRGCCVLTKVRRICNFF